MAQRARRAPQALTPRQGPLSAPIVLKAILLKIRARQMPAYHGERDMCAASSGAAVFPLGSMRHRLQRMCSLA